MRVITAGAMLLLPLSVGARADWLVTPPSSAVSVTPTTAAGGRPAVTMANGLISRTFITSPNWATWELREGDDDLLRSVQPEASFQLDGSNATLLVGGVAGTSNFAFKRAEDKLTR